MDLLLIPFAAYAIFRIFEKLLKKNYVRIIGGILLIIITVVFTYFYVITTVPSLTKFEVWAIDTISEMEDSNFAMVVDTSYATWLYGFSEKNVLAPGIFQSVWNYEEWQAYQMSNVEVKVMMLHEISDKYGKYYLFEGTRQMNSFLEDSSDRIWKIFDLGGARVYEVAP